MYCICVSCPLNLILCSGALGETRSSMPCDGARLYSHLSRLSFLFCMHFLSATCSFHFNISEPALCFYTASSHAHLPSPLTLWQSPPPSPPLCSSPSSSGSIACRKLRALDLAVCLVSCPDKNWINCVHSLTATDVFFGGLLVNNFMAFFHMLIVWWQCLPAY